MKVMGILIAAAPVAAVLGVVIVVVAVIALIWGLGNAFFDIFKKEEPDPRGREKQPIDWRAIGHQIMGYAAKKRRGPEQAGNKEFQGQ